MSTSIAVTARERQDLDSLARRSSASYQEIVRNWIVTRFGEGSLDLRERVARLIEEACELAQASGMPLRDLEVIAAHVYGRPRGRIRQEAAGVAVTLFGLAAADGFDLLEVVD